MFGLLSASQCVKGVRIKYLRSIRERFQKKKNYFHGIFHGRGGRGVPPIRRNNEFFEKNIVVEKNLENCLKWSET